MTLFLAWIVFPALAALACLGFGLLVERASGGRLAGALLLPVGFAAVVVLTELVVWARPVAWLASPLVVAGALAGLALARARLRQVLADPWALAAATAVFGVYAGPVVLSGEPSFAGYTLLGDTAFHFALIDRLMTEGASAGGLPPSSYQAVLDGYFDSSYPTGAHTVLGALRPLAGTDVAWVFQPFLAFVLALAALALYQLVAPVVTSRPVRALVAFVAVQPALVYGYALEGSIKELATLALLILLAALVRPLLAEVPSGRRVVPLAVASAAALAVIDIAAAAWLGPLVLAATVAVVRRFGWRTFIRTAPVYALLTLVAALPTVAGAKAFLDTASPLLTDSEGLGNLQRPLSFVQVFGIWPRGTFLLPLVEHVDLAYVLIGAAALLAGLGAAWLVRRRGWDPLLYLVVSAIGCWYVTRRGGPWADAKALVILSPAIVMTSLLGAVSLSAFGRRAEGAVALALVCGGVLWTNALAYHDADLAPYDRLDELARIGQRFEGQGPAVYTEFEEFNKHFLREMAPTGTGEGFQPFPSLARSGESNRFGFSSDLDVFELAYLDRFATMVVRRSPTASRPPSDFKRTYRGTYYEVWQRDDASGAQVLRHFPYGSGLQRGGTPACGTLRLVAARARAAGARLAYAPAPQLPVFVPTQASAPTGWAVAPDDPEVFRPGGPGRVQGSVTVARPGRYTVWAEGSFGRGVEVALDGRAAGSAAYALNPRGEWHPVGTATLEPGRIDVSLLRGGGSLRPGNGGINRLVGPVALEPAEATDRPVRTLAPRDWRDLCGQSVDWIEIVRDRA